MRLRGKKILLGVTGGIAAFKSCYIVRHFIKAGAQVRVVLSPEARQFVSPLSLATLSKNPVLWEYYNPQDESGQWNNHVELALWADLMLIAPATSNTLAKMASAQSDNFLLGVYLSAKCPVYFAPAMDLDMYRHPGNRHNIEKLQSFGNRFIPAEHGELASGLAGEGRMAEPENILHFIEKDLAAQAPLRGLRFLINGGPTYEAIDPVRFLGNRSSGKMGIALAEAAYERGADVHLVLGPTHLQPAHPGIVVERVESCVEMQRACEDQFGHSHCTILSAAVSDFRPMEPSGQKLKKRKGEGMELKLVQNPDILQGLGAQKRADQLLVGFALETQNALENARAKLHTKNCDWIVLNQPDANTRGFGHDTNEVKLLNRKGEVIDLALKSKKDLAHEILDQLSSALLGL